MNAYQSNARKRRMQMKVNQVSRFLNFKPKSITSLTILLFFVIGAFYVVIVTVVSTKGNDLRTVDLENQQLERENQRLEVEAARLKSLKVINESATGEVEVGDSNSNISNQPISMSEGGVIEVAEADAPKPQPKLVRTTHQMYLPSYYSSVARK